MPLTFDQLRDYVGGKTEPIFDFPDGQFTFWAAEYGSWANDSRVVFRVRADRTPRDRAWEKNIRQYDRLVPATRVQINLWQAGHPDLVGTPGEI